MRLGGPVFEKYDNPEQWANALRKNGYSAGYCPVQYGQDDKVIQDYVNAAKSSNIIIAEVGAWSNPLSPDDKTRESVLVKCQQQLELAENIGAMCCVNISGSRGEKWDGHDPKNLTEATFDMIVETTRKIIDTVKPKRTFYTLETMPWMYPDSADSYVDLIKAVDRKQFAVHLDPTNLICSPQRYYDNGALISECFNKLGRYIKSCHAKDILLSEKLTVHLDEARPGLGNLDYSTYLTELNKLNPDIPLMLEHLPDEEQYRLAEAYIREVARRENVIMV